MRVLHVNEVARAGSSLVREARSRGLEWRLLDTVRLKRQGRSFTAFAERGTKGAQWAARLHAQARAADVVHIHGANVVSHTRWAVKHYVLHLHGTDIRTAQYDLRFRDSIRRAVDEAQLVYYVTPDLREHVRDLRPDAELFPVVADTTNVPDSRGSTSPSKVVFPSRWDASKGGDEQLRIAAEVVRVSENASVEGLAWGENWREAEALGIAMRPRMGHLDYLDWLASATVAVGQTAGILSVSELEAMAAGVPTVAPLRPEWYDGSHPSMRDVPVFGGERGPTEMLPSQIAREVGRLLESPVVTSARSWVESHHGPARAVDRLNAAYQQLQR